MERKEQKTENNSTVLTVNLAWKNYHRHSTAHKRPFCFQGHCCCWNCYKSKHCILKAQILLQE